MTRQNFVTRGPEDQRVGEGVAEDLEQSRIELITFVETGPVPADYAYGMRDLELGVSDMLRIPCTLVASCNDAGELVEYIGSVDHRGHLENENACSRCDAALAAIQDSLHHHWRAAFTGDVHGTKREVTVYWDETDE